MVDFTTLKEENPTDASETISHSSSRPRTNNAATINNNTTSTFVPVAPSTSQTIWRVMSSMLYFRLAIAMFQFGPGVYYAYDVTGRAFSYFGLVVYFLIVLLFVGAGGLNLTGYLPEVGNFSLGWKWNGDSYASTFEHQTKRRKKIIVYFRIARVVLIVLITIVDIIMFYSLLGQCQSVYQTYFTEANGRLNLFLKHLFYWMAIMMSSVIIGFATTIIYTFLSLVYLVLAIDEISTSPEDPKPDHTNLVVSNSKDGDIELQEIHRNKSTSSPLAGADGNESDVDLKIINESDLRRYHLMVLLRKTVQLMCILWLVALMVFFVIGLISAVGLLIDYTKDVNTDVLPGCNPLDPYVCALPFPSSFYLKKDNTTVSGYRVNIPDIAFPKLRDNIKFSPASWNELDGFSTISPIMFFMDGASISTIPGRDTDEYIPGIITHRNLWAYTDEDVSTVLIDAESGERVPHFLELDGISDVRTVPGTGPMFVIQPVVPLKFNKRYVIGVRNIPDKKNNLLPQSTKISQLIAALNTKTKRADDDITEEEIPIDEEAALFKMDILDVLKPHGFTSDDIQLAWDFRTVSRECSLGRAEQMRDDAFSRASNYLNYTVHTIEPNKCMGQMSRPRVIWGTIRVPSYFENGKWSKLNFRPMEKLTGPTGEMDIEFIMIIPCSILERKKPVETYMHYGHGLFSNRKEVRDLMEQAEIDGWVLFGIDWAGLSRFDVFSVLKVFMANPQDIAIVGENMLHGHINMLMAHKFLTTSNFLEDKPFLALDEKPIHDIVNRPKVSFYAISNGAVLGGAYIALSTLHDRGILGVPGAPLALIMPRSRHFSKFFKMMEMIFRTRRDIMFYVTLMQMMFDPAEGGGWLDSMNRNPAKDNQPKAILMQTAIGDGQATSISAHIMARSYQAVTLAKQYREIFGVQEVQEKVVQGKSVIVEWEFRDIRDGPLNMRPANYISDTHMCPRLQPESKHQIADFVRDMTVHQYCKDSYCWSKTCINLDQAQ